MSKKPKLYYIDHKGGLRNLKKANKTLYYSLASYFNNKGGAQQFIEKNEGVKHAKDMQPIVLNADQAIRDMVLSLLPSHKKNQVSFNIYYNSNQLNIVRINMIPKTKKSDELQQQKETNQVEV